MRFLATSAVLHGTILIVAGLITLTSAPGTRIGVSAAKDERLEVDVAHMVFLAPALPQASTGGGGGGNQQPDPVRRAQGVGSDALTVRVRKPADVTAAVVGSSAPVEDVSLPSVVLEAKSLASGIFDQVGLPNGGVSSGTSTGLGAGGGVGTGVGTGIGPGHGRGLGPGTGGGTGGGVYRPGGGVTAPRVLVQVKPTYTSEALFQKIQGTVVVELVVTSEGQPSRIRVIRSLEPGLDEQAVAAVSQWRFEPGRLAGSAVDVLVTIMLDFWIR
jgi:TonB family protein